MLKSYGCACLNSMRKQIQIGQQRYGLAERSAVSNGILRTYFDLVLHSPLDLKWRWTKSIRKFKKKLLVTDILLMAHHVSLQDHRSNLICDKCYLFKTCRPSAVVACTYQILAITNCMTECLFFALLLDLIIDSMRSFEPISVKIKLNFRIQNNSRSTVTSGKSYNLDSIGLTQETCE